MPDAGITTDIIVGFPGETNQEFEESYDFVKEIGFSKIHVFKYSKRKGTPAYDYDDQIDSNVKNERSAKLISLGEELSQTFLNKYIGLRLDVLYEEEYNKDNEEYEGYTTNYIRVRSKISHQAQGEIINTKLLATDKDALVGEV